MDDASIEEPEDEAREQAAHPAKGEVVGLPGLVGTDDLGNKGNRC